MSNEFVHKNVGTVLTQSEYHSIGGHIFNDQVIGDMLYASTSLQLSRLGIGSTNAVLQVVGGVPVWVVNPIISGDILFSGAGTGLAYGGCYGAGILWTQTNAVQNTWYLVSDSDMVDAPLNNITHDGNGKLTATYAGTYLIRISISQECTGASKHLEYGVSVNGAAPEMYQREFYPQVAEEQHGSLTRIITLTAGQTIELAVRTTDTGTPNIIVDNLSVTMVQIGG